MMNDERSMKAYNYLESQTKIQAVENFVTCKS